MTDPKRFDDMFEQQGGTIIAGSLERDDAAGQEPVSLLERDIEVIGSIPAVSSILDVVCRTTGTGFAAVARVTKDRWIAGAVFDTVSFGLQPGGELDIETTFCKDIRDKGQPIVIDHVAADLHYCSHPIPAKYGFESYISVPIRRRDGSFFGTLCALDPRPLPLNTPEVIGMFTLFADLIGFYLEAQDRLATSEAALIDERQAAELREQFIAVLGHDLRNPLASIAAGSRLLAKADLDEKSVSILALMQSSVARMSGLIDNLLDFARGRLGGGLSLDLDTGARLDSIIQQVIAELQIAHPDHTIQAHMDLNGPVRCDSARIGQLLSNLLANALMHGRPDRPVQVRAVTGEGRFALSVSNAGDPIPPEIVERLFQPFFRNSDRASHQGLGLGLYIAAEIARAHGGTLDVVSAPEETRFTFEMPLG